MDLRKQEGIGELWLDNDVKVLTPIGLYFPETVYYQYEHESSARLGRLIMDTHNEFFIEAGGEAYYIKGFVVPHRK